MSEVDYMREALGTRHWAVGRKTANMLARYDVVISPKAYAKLRADFLS